MLREREPELEGATGVEDEAKIRWLTGRECSINGIKKPENRGGKIARNEARNWKFDEATRIIRIGV